MSESLDQPQTPQPRQTRRFSPGSLIIWLLLVPVVFGTLLFFSQLAVVLNLEDLAADTRSLLQAQYNAWPYDEIPPINIEALISDIQKDVQLFGTPAPIPTIEIGDFLKPPTAEVTQAEQPSNTPMPPPPTITATIPVDTPTQPAPSSTNTTAPTVVKITPSPTPTNTRTIAIPTITKTPQQEDTPVPTPTPTNTKIPSTPTHTLPPTFTATAKVPPTNTSEPLPPTFTPTFTPVVVYVPLRPIAENNGKSVVDPEGQGCLAYFGYRNDNPLEIDIPIGDRNHLSETPVRIRPDIEQPTHFYTERISPAFEVVWSNPVPFIWYLDGREASAQWCNP